ncbi:MAG: hypothetical protein AB8G77_20980 [Rhodothermales bacterium]
MKEFSYEDFKGESLKGTPDMAIIKEALDRFRHAQRTIRGKRLDILEFPYNSSNHKRSMHDNVFIRYHGDLHRFEIKVFELGHYSAQQLVGHYLLHERKPESRYEMTIS